MDEFKPAEAPETQNSLPSNLPSNHKTLGSILSKTLNQIKTRFGGKSVTLAVRRCQQGHEFNFINEASLEHLPFLPKQKLHVMAEMLLYPGSSFSLLFFVFKQDLCRPGCLGIPCVD